LHAISRTAATLGALLILANCSQAVEPHVSRASTSPAVEALAGATEADEACLAEAVYFEAGNTPEAFLAVAHVVVNRARDPRFPRTVCGVVRDGCQFSYRCEGKSLTLRDNTRRERAERTAESVLTGAPDITRGALFFHSARANPGWFNTRPRIGEIGGNVFYR
jgi:spore germination cell wall hydrolase CwlJ-like protein